MLERAGYSHLSLRKVLALALKYRQAPAVIALKTRLVSHEAYLAAFAAYTGSHTLSVRAMKALAPVSTGSPEVQINLNRPVLARRVAGHAGRPLLVLAPHPQQFGSLLKHILDMGPDAGRIVLVTPGALRRWLVGYHAS
ncbi:MAG: hypothetical protein AAFY73_02115 [Pseudomonadota bacterium]